MLVIDPELRTEIRQHAKFRQPDPRLLKGLETHPVLMRLDLQNQPDPEALRKIDGVYRDRGLCLSPYALAELNRWVAAGPPFFGALDRLRTALEPSLTVGSRIQSPGFLEAIGALVSDRSFRDDFATAAQPVALAEYGFIVSPLEENALRADFRRVEAFESANTIFSSGWPGGSCMSKVKVPDNILHPNA
jgi:hypothetical protein